MTLPCIACGAELESAWPHDVEKDENLNQPYAGTTFISHGHYGSTVWDPMDDARRLEVNVCDPCLLVAGKGGKVLLGQTVIKRETTLGPWDPERGD